MLIELVCNVIEDKEGDTFINDEGDIETVMVPEITGFTSVYLKFESINNVQSTMDNKYTVLTLDDGDTYTVNTSYDITIARLKMYATFINIAPMVSLEDLDNFLKDMRQKAME